ncbi:hypothetical protein AS590_06595 [Prescottella equi]|uniref:hypothetical protein n=1 Tax=Rhodococcus TaxID=1827 RepID=UPI0005A5D868|nr:MULTISPECIES: hypothetical protein [Rhodococcus]MYV26727.1 hypothetical protein [Rhodococcus erythropolis]OCC17923.1 hypothetical protein AS590_06595 [Prescottella equi]MBW0285013.1 hypothetical protein [Rhodococcus sp. FH8]MBW4816436.1 hypothetical protein [Rhodococcus qingshengii]MCD2134852.1 hypothetical protein [Rhodococcus qingshengii]
MEHVGNEIAESGTDDVGLRALPIGAFIAEADGTAWMQTSYDFQIPGRCAQALSFFGTMEPPI